MCEGYIKLQDYHYLLIGLEMQKQGQQKEKQKNIKGLKKKKKQGTCAYSFGYLPQYIKLRKLY